MKKLLTLALAAIMTMSLLTACGGETAAQNDVDLTAFYNTLAETYGWTEDAASSGENDILMMNVEGDLLESYLLWGLQFLAEPLLLSTWGTTPGKWIFGLQVRSSGRAGCHGQRTQGRAKGEKVQFHFMSLSFIAKNRCTIACIFRNHPATHGIQPFAQPGGINI